MSAIDIAHQVRVWREKAKSSEGLTREELRAGVVMLREDRKMAVVVQDIKKVRKVKAIDTLLSDFAAQMNDVEKP